ncbi:TetR/AcrR family transcriptional regulator [Dactylosporangium siamense]|uniref:TetR family transcriptional regulator n=1 Tax=Dactylosporangium siamense TaxID=685454 RepID=A0A919PGI5_9ACTN|nr:TetR/AcrR family transcriptional regulator [Dactylosporangium siamense]GIG42831.1 TetR family transcriptional regulator [Dactylosporangium siamense]
MARHDRTRLPAAERRRQIIAAATRLVAERGFWGLSMQDVAADCGLTVPGLLHHVGSKDGLLIAILEHRDAEDARALGTLLSGDRTLSALCTALVRRNAGQPEIVRLFAVLEAESLAPDHPAHDYFVARQQRILEDLTALAKDVTDAPETLARRIIALMDGLQLQWLRSPGLDLPELWAATAGELLP